ncbi:MAG TPA: hypothetical protein CFH82_02685, partial [Sulfurospirillum sp. UBA12182]
MKKTFLIFLFFITALQAHSLKIFTTQEAQTLHIFTYFSKSSPCQECLIELTDEKGTIIETTKSDEAGKAVLPIKADKFEIVVQASLWAQNDLEFTSDTPIKPPLEFSVLQVFIC